MRVRRRLYEEYKVQAREPSLSECLSASELKISDQTSYFILEETSRQLYDVNSSEPLQRACFRFEDALARLPNLRHVGATFNNSFFPTAFKWRGIAFDNRKVSQEFSICSNLYVLARNILRSEEVVPLAFLLQVLGRRGSLSSSLVSLSLDLSIVKWWGLEALDSAWIPRTAGSAGTTHSDRSRALMTDAFINLADLGLSMGPGWYHTPAHVDGLASYLDKARNLVSLSLKNTHRRPDRDTEKDLLSILNERARWPRLKNLRLNVDVKASTLLTTLSCLAPYLTSLELTACSFEEDSWLNFYQQMREIPFAELRRLNLRNLIQQNMDTSAVAAPLQGICFEELRNDPSMVVHECLEGQVYPFTSFRQGHFCNSADLYRYILRETDAMPDFNRYFINCTDTEVTEAE